MSRAKRSYDNGKRNCTDCMHTNYFAVICIDSCEDESDFLDLHIVKDPDISWQLERLKVVKVWNFMSN